jgi:GrpB-like predicted nucleotidyltransferase (UPF0157 family)
MPAPVIIVPYDPAWPDLFLAEQTRIQAAIGPHIRQIEHMGSTAVPGLAAKPIIDIMIGLAVLADAPACIAPLEALGYTYVPEYEADMPDRRYFSKGRGTPGGATHHIHMVELGGTFWNRHLLFRDYLRAHPADAAAYGDLKRRLAAAHRSDRAAYTDAKTAFITGIEAKAQAWRDSINSGNAS